LIWSKTPTYNSIPSRWSRVVCRGLGKTTGNEGMVAHLVFSIEIQSNNLTYEGNTYTKHQQFLYTLCKQLHDKGYGYRRIAKMLNKWNVKTHRGNTWFNTSVSSILKRKHQRDARIQDVRNRKFAIKIGKFSIKYFYL